MTSQILVPLDGSSLAERALPCATALARALRADLVLLRAVSLPPDVVEILEDANQAPVAPLEQLESDAASYLDEVACSLKENGLSVQSVVLNSPAAEAIVDYADKAEIELIVMATHGYSGISRWTHGSVAERVLRAASVPVLMVCAKKAPEEGKAVTCQRILVPLDGSPVAEQVLPPATAIARALDAEINLLRVPMAQITGSLTGEWFIPLEGNFESAHQVASVYLDRVADRLRGEGLRVSTAVQSGAVANVIVEYADANKIDLIAMCTHGRTGLARWTMGSVADRVLRARCVPVLLVHAQ